MKLRNETLWYAVHGFFVNNPDRGCSLTFLSARCRDCRLVSSSSISTDRFTRDGRHKLHDCRIKVAEIRRWSCALPTRYLLLAKTELITL